MAIPPCPNIPARGEGITIVRVAAASKALMTRIARTSGAEKTSGTAEGKRAWNALCCVARDECLSSLHCDRVAAHEVFYLAHELLFGDLAEPELVHNRLQPRVRAAFRAALAQALLT